MTGEPATPLPPRERFLAALKALGPFSALPGDVQEALFALAVPRRYETGEVVYLAGEKAEWFYILESGWIKATRMTREGREQGLRFMQPVELFGDVAVFSGTAYPGDVTALEAVTVWALPGQGFRDLMRRYPDLSQAVIHSLSRRILYYVDLVADLSLKSVEARLAGTLLQHAQYRDGQWFVPRRGWTTFDEMAVRLGTVRDVLRRASKVLEAEGLIRVEKQAIRLLDPKALETRAES